MCHLEVNMGYQEVQRRHSGLIWATRRFIWATWRYVWATRRFIRATQRFIRVTQRFIWALGGL